MAVSVMARLVGQGLLEKVATYDRMGATVPSLLHSKMWVQQDTVGLVASLAARLDTVGVQMVEPYLLQGLVKVGSLVAHYLLQGMVQVNRPHLHLGQLKEPVPSQVSAGASAAPRHAGGQVCRGQGAGRGCWRRWPPVTG